jgi:hypothetical protein
VKKNKILSSQEQKPEKLAIDGKGVHSEGLGYFCGNPPIRTYEKSGG